MKGKLHPVHLAIVIHMIQTGVILLSLPQQLAVHFGHNGWIALLGFSLIVTINLGLIAIVYRLGRARSIFAILEQSIPKLMLLPFYLGMAAAWAILGAMVAKQYVIIFQMLAFPTTHPMMLLSLIEALTFLLLIKGIVCITRAATIFFCLIIWMLLLLFCFFSEFDWSRMTPFLLQGGDYRIEGALNIYGAFIGYELCMLLFPYVQSKHFFKSVSAGNLLTTLSYTSVSLICFGFYSSGQLKLMLYPTLDLLAYIRFPFIERIENLLFGFFLFTVIITIVAYSWASQEVFKRIVPKLPTNWLSLGIVALSYAVSWIPDVLDEVQSWLKYLGYFELGVAFALPMLLLVLLLVQGRKEVPGNA